VTKKIISDKHKKVVNLFLTNGGNKTKALIGAGYAPVTADRNPERIFNRPEVIEYVNQQKILAAERNELDQDWIIERLMDLADSGRVLAKYKKVQEDGSLAWDFTGVTEKELSVIQAIGVDYYTEGRGPDGVTVKKFRIKEPDVRQALVDLGRTMALFTDKVEVSNDLAERLREGQRQAYQRNRKDRNDDTVH
jgi:hypothetical protein